MMLDPLAEVVVRMLVSVLVCGSELVVNILRRRKRSQDDYHRNEPGDDADSSCCA